jgi:predicted DNA-binding transcriptional regulator AlpA
MTTRHTVFIDDKQLSEQLSISVETLRKWRYEDPHKGPRFRKLGRSVRYSVDDVEEWLSRGSG